MARSCARCILVDDYVIIVDPDIGLEGGIVWLMNFEKQHPRARRIKIVAVIERNDNRRAGERAAVTFPPDRQIKVVGVSIPSFGSADLVFKVGEGIAAIETDDAIQLDMKGISYPEVARRADTIHPDLEIEIGGIFIIFIIFGGERAGGCSQEKDNHHEGRCQFYLTHEPCPKVAISNRPADMK